MRILIIEDDKKTADFVDAGFHQTGFTTVVAHDGEEGLRWATVECFDVAVIDIMLPKMDGLTVIRKIRATGNKMPVIVLSAKGSVENKIEGLNCGSDDYLAKPFSLSELIARVQALLRRATGVGEQNILTIDDLTLDLTTRKVTRAGQRIELQPLELQLLEYLMRNCGRVVSKTTVMEHVWDYEFDPHTNVVEARVCRLREKINVAGKRKLIRTVRGFGYVLE